LEGGKEDGYTVRQTVIFHGGSITGDVRRVGMLEWSMG
jgi:hypothetical protein